jgi:transcription antitermination factor NusG
MNELLQESRQVVAPLVAANPTIDHEVRWHVVQTRSRHEKCVDAQMGCNAIESYLPLFDSVRKWKDRRKRLPLPLFSGYVFVRIAWRERLRVLKIPGVVRLVSFAGVPAFLEDAEVERLRKGLLEGLRAEPHPFLTMGRRVRVRGGPLAGCEGVLKRWKDKARVVISLEMIHRSIALDIDASSLELLSSARKCPPWN